MGPPALVFPMVGIVAVQPSTLEDVQHQQVHWQGLPRRRCMSRLTVKDHHSVPRGEINSEMLVARIVASTFTWHGIKPIALYRRFGGYIMRVSSLNIRRAKGVV